MGLRKVEFVDDRGCVCLHQIDSCGFKQGEFKKYYPNGVILCSGTYLDGLRTGTYLEYYPNGKLWVEASYRKGDRHGEYTVYTPDGKIKIHRFYKKGQIVKQTISIDIGDEDYSLSVIEPECNKRNSIDMDVFVNSLVKNILGIVMQEIKSTTKE